MPDPATSVRRKPGPAARPFDEARALELLRAGWPAYKVRREFGVQGARILELAKANGLVLRPGPAPRPFDEDRALALLRDGLPLHRVRAEVGGGLRRIRTIAVANGIGFRRKHTDVEIRGQTARIAKLRKQGFTWRGIAKRLGYANPDAVVSSLVRRARAAGIAGAPRRDPYSHAWRTRALLRSLRKANGGRETGWDDLESFVRLASDPRRQWLLSPDEIELARKRGLLAAAQ